MSVLVMLGSPVLEPLSVGRPVLRAVRSVARLGDLGVPGVFSTRCADGACCAAFREDLRAPLSPDVRAVAIYSRSDGIVSVRTQMDKLKQSGQAVAGEVLTSLSGFAPPLLLALGGRLAARSPNLGVQTGVTNVPGPQQPLQTLGRRMLESFPFVPLIGNVRISIAIFSYNGGLYFGVTGDYDSSSDIDVLTAGVERGAAELLRVSQAAGRAREEVAPERPKSKARGARAAGAPPTQRA